MTERGSFQYEDVDIPIKVIRERRRSVRAFLGKTGGILRVPVYLSETQFLDRKKWFLDWLKTQIDRQPQLLARYKTKTYHNGQHIHLNGKDYFLVLEKSDNKTSKARLEGDQVLITLSNQLKSSEKVPTIQKLLSKVIGQDQLLEIQDRVRQLNKRHFNQSIRDIQLRYKHSNWGTCSNNGKIILSTRLLFAPRAVQDYVIIHELAHLLEFNHSKRFWQIVAKADPAYKVHEKWLKENGSYCDF